MKKMLFGRYDYAAFAMFAAYAAVTVAIPTVLPQLAEALGFPLEAGGTMKAGWLAMTRNLVICMSLVASGFIAGRWGNRRPLGVALMLVVAGMLACSVAPAYAVLLMALVVTGAGEGIVEGLGTPFVQGLHEKESGRYMNFSHGFWSFGVIAATLLFGWLVFRGVSWRVILALAAVFALVPMTLLLAPRREGATRYPERAEKPSARRVAAQAGEIAREPRFWVFFCAMIFAGGAEIGITFWVPSMVKLMFGGTAMQGGAALAIFGAGMFAGRTGYGFVLHQRHLKGLVIATGCLAAIVCVFIPALARSDLPWKLHALYALLFVAGLGAAPHWPSIQTYAVEKMPHLDATMVFVMLSCAGVPGSGLMTLIIGWVGKPENLGLENALYIIPVCFAVMVTFMLAERIAEKLRVES